MYQNNGNHYFKKWAKRFPDEIDSHDACYKCINSRDEIFLQTDCDMDTICYDINLQKQYTVNHKGRLVDSIDGELFYLLANYVDKQRVNKIVVHKDRSAGPICRKTTSKREDFSEPLTLQPQWRRWYNLVPSVCRIQQNYVVVEHVNKAMDVFNWKGLFVSLD